MRLMMKIVVNIIDHGVAAVVVVVHLWVCFHPWYLCARHPWSGRRGPLQQPNHDDDDDSDDNDDDVDVDDDDDHHQ